MRLALMVVKAVAGPIFNDTLEENVKQYLKSQNVTGDGFLDIVVETAEQAALSACSDPDDAMEVAESILMDECPEALR